MKRTPRVHRRTGPGGRPESRVALGAVVVALALAGCSSTGGTSGASGSRSAPIPASAFSNHTGVTNGTIRVGNISTHAGDLFSGADIGAQAYAAYVDSTGGVDGRKLVVDTYDDHFDGPTNKLDTEQAMSSDFALVGSFSLEDNFGGQLLKATPGMPDVAVTLDPKTGELANVFSPQPNPGGWNLGPLAYFKSKYPDAVMHAASLVANEPSAITAWNGEHAAMLHLGYHISYEYQYAVTQFDFNANVLAMKNAGVKILFIEQMPYNYAGPVMRALAQQNFHPIVVFGASTYSTNLISASGGPANTDGAYLQQSDALYLGEDASTVPAINTFLTWVQKIHPGWTPDLFTLYGWTSMSLFVQALHHAGSDPSRGSLLKALRGITSFDADHILAPVNPAQNLAPTCFIVAKAQGNHFVRYDDPPISGATHGFRCGSTYYG